MQKWNIGDKAFIVETNMSIREVSIAGIRGNRCLVSWAYGKGMNIPEKRLFRTEEEALESTPELIRLYGRKREYLDRYNAQLL